MNAMPSSAPARVSVQDVRRKLKSGAPMLLVSAYPRIKYDQFHLEGAIPLEDLDGTLAGLGKDYEIVFY